MDTQVVRMYQRNTDDQSPTGRQRSGDGSNDSNGGSPRNNGRQLLKLSLLLGGIVLISWCLLQFFSPGSRVNEQRVGEGPYSVFYKQVQEGNVTDASFQRQDIN